MPTIDNVWVGTRVIGSKTVYQARFISPDGSVLAMKTLRDATSERSARKLARELLPEIQAAINEKAEAAKPESENPYALEYMLHFWTPTSEYYESRQLRDRAPTLEYVKQSRNYINSLARPFLEPLRMKDIRPIHVENMIRALAKAKVAGRSINQIVQAIRTPVAEFHRSRGLASPLPSIPKVAERLQTRGTLSQDEVAALIALPKLEPRIRCAILLGALAGLRLGECRGLHPEDVDLKNGILHIRNNFTSGTARPPKCGSTRDVPAPSIVLEAIHACSATMPHICKAGYILWNTAGNAAPCSAQFIEKGFRNALAAIGIDEETRIQRVLVFHGLRHTFVSLSKSAGIPDYIVSRMAGHSTLEMTENYTHASLVDFQSARARLEASLTGSKVNPAADRIRALEEELAKLRAQAEGHGEKAV